MRPTYSSLGRYLLEVATYLFDPGTLPTAWLCRRRQRHRQGPHRLPERRRTRHPDRRRTIDELRFGADFRGLLQLCAEFVDPTKLRLPVHRQSRLQRRPRPGQRLRRTLSLAILAVLALMPNPLPSLIMSDVGPKCEILSQVDMSSALPLNSDLARRGRHSAFGA